MQKSEKKIAIIGLGYVGGSAFRMVKEHYKTKVYSPNLDEDSCDDNEMMYEWPEDNFSDCELAIVCVPTPMGENNECDTSLVEDTIKKLDSKLILIKSTVAPGTTDRLREETGKSVVFSPEYIGESTYDHEYKFQVDMLKTPFLILGGDAKDTSAILGLLVPILGPQKTYYQISAKEAEVIKYMENSYFGTKVIFANEMKRICDALGVDYFKVRTGWALDPRVDQMHTMVFPGNSGFGGKCLPKDINGIVQASIKAGYEPKLLKQVLASNDEMREEDGLNA